MWQISEITPRIYLGDIEGAANRDLLKRKGITHIVNLSYNDNFYPADFKYLKIDIEDEDNVNIYQYFAPTKAFIDKALSDKKSKVFVHCMAGISRSVTIVVAYLMNEMTYREALAYVRSKRSIANPNPGFIRQLQIYEETFTSGKGNAPSGNVSTRNQRFLRSKVTENFSSWRL